MDDKVRRPGLPHSPRQPGAAPGVSVYAESDTEVLMDSNRLVAVGYNHRTADLAIRSRFAIPSEDLSRVTRAFAALPGVKGCVLVTTCNRVEAYLDIRSEAEAEAAFVEILGGTDLEGRRVLARSLMVRSNGNAARHLCRVASGLDSMVLGDAQILGQTRQAYKDACAIGTASPILHKVFHVAFRCGKQVRSATAIGGAHSVAGTGVSMLGERLGGLRGRKFLLVGVNKMTRTAAKRVYKASAAHVLITNRTDDRAKELARDSCAEYVPWAERLEAAGRVDAVITATGSTEPIFTLEELADAVQGRDHLPLMVVDMAVPPDVAPAVNGDMRSTGDEAAAGPATDEQHTDEPPIDEPPIDELVQVITIEDIGHYQAGIQERRCAAAADGEAIIDHQIQELARWLAGQQHGPQLKRLREELDAVLARELERLPGDLSDAERERLDGFAEMLARRFMAAYKRVDEE